MTSSSPTSGEPPAAPWQAQMGIENYEYQSDFAKKFISQGRAEGRTEGRAEGRAEGRTEALLEAILDILHTRGLAVSDEVRNRLQATTDPDVLRAWHRRALVAATADDVFGP